MKFLLIFGISIVLSIRRKPTKEKSLEFTGVYKFGDSENWPNNAGVDFEECCTEYLGICGTYSIISKSGKALSLVNPSRNATFSCHEKKGSLKCVQKTDFGRRILMINSNLEVRSPHSMIVNGKYKVPCGGQLLKVNDKRIKAKYNLKNYLEFHVF